MAEQSETLMPTPKPPAAVPESRYVRMIKLLREMIGSQALQIAELKAILEERTLALREVQGELAKLKPAPPAGENDGNQDRRG